MQTGRLKPRQQGDLGEVSAMVWMANEGYSIFVPIGHSPDVDFVATRDHELVRVQVKTTTCRRNGRWMVTLATRGGNRSWSGLVKYFTPDRCDLLVVVSADGRRWCIPAGAVEGGSAICLGGPKYAEFEVDRGRPLMTSAAV